MGNFWQQINKVTIAGGGGTKTITFNYQSPIERLTIWVSSGQRSIPNLSFQLQINGTNFGGAVTVVGAKAAKLIFQSGGATTENDMFPAIPPAIAGQVDPFVLTCVITNADAAAADVTVLATAIQHGG